MKLNKYLRIGGVVVIVIGFAFVFFATSARLTAKFEAFNEPSYFTLRNYGIAIITGSLGVAVALVSSFFSWFRSLDVAPDELLNPVAATKEEIDDMVGTSTLGTAPEVTSYSTTTENEQHDQEERQVESSSPARSGEVESTHTITEPEQSQPEEDAEPNHDDTESQLVDSEEAWEADVASATDESNDEGECDEKNA